MLRKTAVLTAAAAALGTALLTPADAATGVPTHQRMLFVGGSYVQGLGSSAPENGFPAKVAHHFGDAAIVDGITGTGYQAAGKPGQGTVAQRLALEPATPAPAVVILHAGRNDTGYPIEKEYGATLNAIRTAQQRFPLARVVVIGPVPPRAQVEPDLALVNTVIGKAAARARVGFIDPIGQGWITRANQNRYAGEVLGHPNDAGYSYLAGRIELELPKALAVSVPAQP